MTELQQALIERINELTDEKVHIALAAWVYGMKHPEATTRECVQSIQSGYTLGSNPPGFSVPVEFNKNSTLLQKVQLFYATIQNGNFKKSSNINTLRHITKR